MQYVNATPCFGQIRVNRSARFFSHEKLSRVLMSKVVFSKYEDDDNSYEINSALFREEYLPIVGEYDSAGGAVRPAKLSTQMAVIDHCLKAIDAKYPGAGVNFPVRILDFTAAYMERAVAAKTLERIMTQKSGKKFTIIYHGVDPDSKIAATSARISSEIGAQFRDIPLEQFVHTKPYHIVLMSTPPYDLEVYGGDCGVAQTYKSFDGWKFSFWNEVLYRAKSCLVDGGVFSFTCLDRPQRPDRAYTGHATTQALKMFNYNSTFVVGKSTPWWTFTSNDLIPFPQILLPSESERIQTRIASVLLSANLIDQEQFRHEVFRTGSILGGSVNIVNKDLRAVVVSCLFGSDDCAAWQCESTPNTLMSDLHRLVSFTHETGNENATFTFKIALKGSDNHLVFAPQEDAKIYTLLGGEVHHSSRCIERDVVLSRIFNNKKISHVFSSPMLQDAMSDDANAHGLELIHYSPISAGKEYLGQYVGARDDSVLLMNPPREVFMSRFKHIFAWSVMAESSAVGITIYRDEGIFSHGDDGVVRLTGITPNRKYPDAFDFASKISQLILSCGGQAIVLDQKKFYQIDCHGEKFVNEKRDKQTVPVVFLRGIKDMTVLSELSK